MARVPYRGGSSEEAAIEARGTAADGDEAEAPRSTTLDRAAVGAVEYGMRRHIQRSGRRRFKPLERPLKRGPSQARGRCAGSGCGWIVPRGRQMIQTLLLMLRRHRRCSYHKLLCFHSMHAGCDTSSGTWSDAHHLAWALGGSVIPSCLLGDIENVRTLLAGAARSLAIAKGLKVRHVEVLAGLTDRLRTFSVAAAAAAAAGSGAPSSSNRSVSSLSAPTAVAAAALACKGSRGRGARHAACARRQLLSLGCWLTLRLLLPSLRRMVVNLSNLRHADGLQSCVWPRGQWKVAFRSAARKVVRGSLQPVRTREAPGLLSAPERSSGCATLRLLPKAHGDFRTIYNLSSVVKLPRRWVSTRQLRLSSKPLTQSVNASVAPLIPLFTALRRQHPSAFATSLLGIGEVHDRWRRFVAERRRLAPYGVLDFGASDLAGCYDTIAQPRLFQSLQFAMRLLFVSACSFDVDTVAVAIASLATRIAPSTSIATPAFPITAVAPPPAHLLVHKAFHGHHASRYGLLLRPAIDACDSRRPTDTLTSAAHLAASGVAHAAIFTERASLNYAASRQSLLQLREQVFCNIITLAGRFFVQRCVVVRP